MKKLAFILLINILSCGFSMAQNQIILTNEGVRLFQRDGSYAVDREQMVFNRENTTTLYYRKKPGKKLRKFKTPVDLSFFTDSLDYSILDSVLTHSIHENFLHPAEHPCKCEFMDKGSTKITLKSGEAMAGKIQSYEFGMPRECNDVKYTIYMHRLNDEYKKLYKLVFD